MEKERQISKKGFIFALPIIIITLLAVASIIMLILLIFNQNIKDSINIIFNTLKAYGKWALIIILIIIFKDVIIQMVLWIFGLIKSLVARII